MYYLNSQGSFVDIGSLGSSRLTVASSTRFRVYIPGSGTTGTLKLGMGGAFQTLMSVVATPQTIRVGQGFAALTASNQPGSSIFTRQSGTIPLGVTLNADGSFSGTATQAGSYPVRFTVKDDRGVVSVSKLITLTVNPRTRAGPGSLGIRAGARSAPPTETCALAGNALA